MSKTQYYAAATLDGYIAGADDDLDWLTGYQGSYDGPKVEPREGRYEGFYDGVGALVMGSATYEWLLDQVSTWPYPGRPTWILTSRELPMPAGDDVDVRIVDGRVPDLYPEMMAAAGDRNLWVVGGGNVASQFADERLLDELIVTVVPVVLGTGKPLFDRPVPGGPMQLVEAHALDSGMVELRYTIERA